MERGALDQRLHVWLISDVSEERLFDDLRRMLESVAQRVGGSWPRTPMATSLAFRGDTISLASWAETRPGRSRGMSASIECSSSPIAPPAVSKRCWWGLRSSKQGNNRQRRDRPVPFSERTTTYGERLPITRQDNNSPWRAR